MTQYRNLVLLCFALVTCAFYSANAQSDNKINCVNELIDWCNTMSYPSESTAMGSISTTILDTDATGELKKLSCKSNYRGTKCTEDHSPWFTCSSQNKLTYRGTLLQKNSIAGADDDICNTSNKAFSVLSLQNMTFGKGNGSRSLNEGMKHLKEGMKALREGLRTLDDSIFQDCFPFCGGNPFGI